MQKIVWNAKIFFPQSNLKFSFPSRKDAWSLVLKKKVKLED